MQNITKENYHIFAKQKGSIKAHGRLDNKLFFTPSTLHSKSHQSSHRPLPPPSRGELELELSRTRVLTHGSGAALSYAQS
jgi:hypothetical protein